MSDKTNEIRDETIIQINTIPCRIDDEVVDSSDFISDAGGSANRLD